MENDMNPAITIQVKVNAPAELVWKCWTSPDDIVKWNNAYDNWHTPRAENDLKPGGKFLYLMEAKDGSFGFDFWGHYTEVIYGVKIAYTLGDGRKVSILFKTGEKLTEVVETFELENGHPVEVQHGGWQSILDNFKNFVEKQTK